MKRLIAAGILTLFVVGAALFSYFATYHYHDTLLEELTACKNEYTSGNKETAATLAAEFCNKWEKAHFSLAAFVNRDTIDEIEMSVARMASFAQSQEDSQFFAECALTEMLFEDMLERERLTLLTIF